ncbi:MAG: tetratricopeptide repeat protein [Deltaproteobacteria bacterium]|jgi:outer membrane protein assembly factor BamD|nr:tetratricopeptide repeat protein [Deltaproteobacteria bacterium]MBW2534391.1 tetratricopeptide repeat protein [Deltaproteobacteria bacterium]
MIASRWRRPLLWISVVAALGTAACDVQSTAASPASLTYTQDAHRAYREAMEAFEAKDWEDARALLEEVKRRFSPSRYARLAELRLADVDFEQAKYNEAISGYRAFIRAHRSDLNAEYAKYRIGKSLFLDIEDTVLLPAQEERDQAGTRDAFRELRSFNRRYPRSRYRVDVTYMLEMVTQRLVRHELYVARYYLRHDNFEATVARVDYALKKFPGSGLDAEALVLKGETLLKMGKKREAAAVLRSVIRNHGGPFGRVAQRFVDQLELPAAAPAAAPPRPSEPSEGEPAGS